MVKTALEIAKDTIDILNERGWRQGPGTYGDSSLCLGQAVGAVTFYVTATTKEESDQQFAEMTKLRLTLEAVIWAGKVEPRNDWGSIVNWNDAPGRTKQDVMEALDKSMDVLIPAVS